MDNEIKVNDYVRLKDGTIAKVIKIKNQNTDIFNWYCLDNDMGTMDRSIVKHSSNLIDLIQCGDYVNGYKVAPNSVKDIIEKIVILKNDNALKDKLGYNNYLKTIKIQ